MKRRIRAFVATVLTAAAIGCAVLAAYVIPALRALPDDRQLRVILTSAQIRANPTADGKTDFVCHCPLPVAFDELPPQLRDALVATEDRRFYRHGGVDYRALARALVADVKNLGAVEGGSTLTQQLAKNVLFHRQDWLRKFLEIPVAWQIERLFSKRRILALYLDNAYFGYGTIGIGAAARRFFGKAPRDLNLYEAAVIVGMLKAPSRYNPERDPQAARERAGAVLQRMIRAGFISRAQAERALTVGARPGALAPVRLDARYHMDWIRAELQAQSRGAADPLRFVVGLDPRMQAEAERTIAKLLQDGEAAGVRQAALVAMTPDGVVRAMIGGRSYAESQFNRATQARRQTGSAFKIFTYLAALERGWKPTDEVLDAPLAAGWPANADGRYRGRVPLQDAFALSLNGAAVHLARDIGPGRIAATARRFGIPGPLPDDLGLALGAAQASLLDMTGAYTALANGGRRVVPHGVIGVLGRRGEVVSWRAARKGPRLARDGHVRALASMLRLAVRRGTGWRAALPGVAAQGKTGTTTANRDAWFVGFTDRLVTGIWAGNDDDAGMAGVTGGTLPAVAFRRFNVGLAARPRPNVAGPHRRAPPCTHNCLGHGVAAPHLTQDSRGAPRARLPMPETRASAPLPLATHPSAALRVPTGSFGICARTASAQGCAAAAAATS